MGVGRRVLDRYVLIRTIGQGGISLIFEAIDTERLMPVAVKVLSPALLDYPRTVSAARHEADIMRRLRHPSVPVVYDDGEVPVHHRGGYGSGAFSATLPCVAMELLTGAPLAQRLETGGPLPWWQAVRFAATIADLLAVAHRRGVVHRDLTASNIMLTPGGVKIIDFGLARESGALAGATGPLTSVGEPADDVHALGVLLYQMLTGRSPYPNAGPGASLALARFGIPAPAPVLLVPGLPPAVADLCRRCLRKRAADRPTSVAVALELWSVLDF